MMSCSRGCCPDQRSHFRSVAVARVLVEGNRADQKVARDRDAYRELKAQGYQPKRLDGAHELARDARSAAEIEGRPG
jgi:hypothetical protein